MVNTIHLYYNTLEDTIQDVINKWRSTCFKNTDNLNNSISITRIPYKILLVNGVPLVLKIQII